MCAAMNYAMKIGQSVPLTSEPFNNNGGFKFDLLIEFS